MTTMADVARHAGVSVSTVSHVVNDTRSIAPATRERVLAAIAATGFVSNGLARSLRMSSTATIGLAISALSNFYFADLVAAIDAAVRSAGSTLLLADTHEDPAIELDVLRSLHARRVDGILLAPVTASDGPGLQYLRRAKIPAVLVDRCPADDFDQVGVENIESTAALSRHLAEIGHTRIAMISGVPGIRTTVERLEGYRLGLQSAGIEFDPALVAPGMSDATGASAAVRRLLQTPRPPTAVVIANNHMTIGAMRELRARGIRVPEDLAVVTFDDFDWADVFAPRLTAIAQPIEAIAARAVELLLARIRGTGGPVTTEHFPGVWHHRDSCGCLDPAVDVPAPTG